MKKVIRNKKSGKKKWWKLTLAAAALLFLILLGSVGVMFREELEIANSIHLIEDGKNAYSMEINSDYHFGEFLEAGGASSDMEVNAFLTKCISKGFYQIDTTNEGPSCSVISAMDEKNSHIWGRNFDWGGSVPIIVKSTPKDGYSSISTCDFQNITDSPEALPNNIIRKMLAIAALYVPMDGVNEAGLCVADLEVNEGGMKDIDTEKPDLTVTTAIRLLLNHAATVEEAINLLRKYDIHASGGISHHLAISDASGASASLEFIDGEVVEVDTNCITNFNLANGDTSAGGGSSQERYELLCSIYKEKNGILSNEEVKSALSQVAKTEGKWQTQWSVIYNQDTLEADYYFKGNYSQNAIKISMKH